MNLLKKITASVLGYALLASLLITGSAPLAVAQGFGPTYVTPAQQVSYSAAVIALTPAASATDFLVINGSATHQVRIRRIHCDSTSTAAATINITVVKRGALDTGGTSTSPTYVRLNVANPVATAVIKAYTVNPTLGTIDGIVQEKMLTSNTAASSALNNVGVDFDFTNQFLMINSATASVALNANATSFTAGTSLNCWVEWTEV